MRRITRVALAAPTQRALDRRQTDADTKRAAGTLVVDREWNSARRTRPLRTVTTTLAEMTGPRERCMYCCDSHGTDIDHFWPKAEYPERMFRWPNLLLSCTECGRFKGRQFPVENGDPRLVDPTAEDPWQFLDFDPELGVVVARYDMASSAENPKGVETVRVLQLDRREALNDGYRKTWRRLVAAAEAALQQPPRNAGRLVRALRVADDHGLLGWCFAGNGQRVAPFSTLRNRLPAAWAACVHAFA